MTRIRSLKKEDELLKSKYLINNPSIYKGRWQEFFGNSNPIYLEIGMGKGQFISEMAKQNPDINFIGLEISEKVITRAIKKRADVNNLYFLSLDALKLGDVFEKKEVNHIYLTFSDPWPKKRHEKRRLTAERFLNIYKTILDGELELKTDNLGFFIYSLKMFYDNSFLIKEFKSNYDSLIKTEYETKYKEEGRNIYYLRVKI